MDEMKKLERFREVVFAEVDLQTAQLKAEVEELKKQEIELATDNELSKKFNYIQKKASEIRQRYMHDVAKFSLDSKRRILEKRNEMVDEVFSSVKERLVSFTDSNEYETYLSNKLTEFNKAHSLTGKILYVSRKDFELASKIKENLKFDCEVSKSASISIGGFAVKSEKDSTYFDETLDQKLDEQKTYFIENSGLAI